jgi:hypothetical protein
LLYSALIEKRKGTTVEARNLVRERPIPDTNANAIPYMSIPSSKPQQFPSIVEALIAWQQRQVCCIRLSVYILIWIARTSPSEGMLESSIVTYDTVYAPPATVFLQDLQSQIPTECLLTVVFPQNVQTYLACCVISIFLTCFRREAPYL